jgi:zinc finger protein
MACQENGTTRLLLTRIPFFRDVIIMSFECPHCGYRNNEIQPTGTIAEMACRFELFVDVHTKWNEAMKLMTYPNNQIVQRDLLRQIVKSDAAVIRIPEIDFEIPRSKRGEITTIEGILTTSADNLERDQEDRRAQDPNVADAVQKVITKLRAFAEGHEPFTFVLEDLSGNSYLENPNAPEKDPRVKITHWARSAAETEEIGYMLDEHLAREQKEDDSRSPPQDTGKEHFAGGKVGGKIKAGHIMVAKEVNPAPHDLFFLFFVCVVIQQLNPCIMNT